MFLETPTRWWPGEKTVSICYCLNLSSLHTSQCSHSHTPPLPPSQICNHSCPPSPTHTIYHTLVNPPCHLILFHSLKVTRSQDVLFDYFHHTAVLTEHDKPFIYIFIPLIICFLHTSGSTFKVTHCNCFNPKTVTPYPSLTSIHV